jgi:hypothetical protein
MELLRDLQIAERQLVARQGMPQECAQQQILDTLAGGTRLDERQ